MNSKGGTRPVLSAEAQSFFNQGIALIFSQWTALDIAIEKGGPYSHRKADLAAAKIFEWFTHSRELDIYYLEDMLHEALEELNTLAEDHSVEQVAAKLKSMHDECVDGNYQSIEMMRSQTRTQANVVRIANENDDDSSEDDSDEEMVNDSTIDTIGSAAVHRSNSNPVGMQVDNEPSSTQVADSGDGWSVVSSRRSKGKRN